MPANVSIYHYNINDIEAQETSLKNSAPQKNSETIGSRKAFLSADRINYYELEARDRERLGDARNWKSYRRDQARHNIGPQLIRDEKEYYLTMRPDDWSDNSGHWYCGNYYYVEEDYYDNYDDGYNDFIDMNPEYIIDGEIYG